MGRTKPKPEPPTDAAGAPAGYISADERRAAGKALRDATPRVAHGGWKPPKTGAIPSSFCTSPMSAGFRT